MDYHRHARLTLFSRAALAKAAAKWVKRYSDRGVAGLRDRSSRPDWLRQPTSAELVARVEALRRERWTGLRIAQLTGLSRATMSRSCAG